MAWTATDVAKLREAIGLGALEVEYSDGRRVKYRSLSEMMRLLSMMEAEANGTTSANPRVTYAEFSRD